MLKNSHIKYFFTYYYIYFFLKKNYFPFIMYFNNFIDFIIQFIIHFNINQFNLIYLLYKNIIKSIKET